MTKDEWADLQKTLRAYKASERAVDKLQAKLDEARAAQDELAEKVREMMPAKGE
jgi:hypothetical protein